MSLLDDTFEDFRVIDKTKAPDGYGGTIDTWNEGITIKAVAVLDSSEEMKVAMAQGVKASYTITTSKNVNLQYHDVIRRVRDNKIFRITSDGDDKHTPASATLNMRQVTAEEWELTT